MTSITGTTGSIVELECRTTGKWKGQEVEVISSQAVWHEHQLEVMHHFEDDGKHYCPTGFLFCPECGGVAIEPEPNECTLWGEYGPEGAPQ